jgi:predicted PurR-regulated permease PerM
MLWASYFFFQVWPLIGKLESIGEPNLLYKLILVVKFFFFWAVLGVSSFSVSQQFHLFFKAHC